MIIVIARFAIILAGVGSGLLQRLSPPFGISAQALVPQRSNVLPAVRHLVHPEVIQIRPGIDPSFVKVVKYHAAGMETGS